jgi:ribosomal protein S27E
MKMRALSLTQPWANMVAERAKPIETRTWSTPYRGWLLVCATRQVIPDCPGPYGMALAVAALTDCRPMTKADEPLALCFAMPGPWAWVLDGIEPLGPDHQFPMRGQLGLFMLEVPPAHEDHVRQLLQKAREGKPIDLAQTIGFFDVQCGRCGRRFGWHGHLADRPPCPGCGRLVPQNSAGWRAVEDREHGR